ncbi:RHS repeat-associated core domain-containing protein [Pseudomonas jessenii]|uniref:RHS repeat-associated core domain-containing protein n=1 Tax=Pseudomonas jessenii TaxID=77298 RepID=UPI00389214DE
MPSHSHKTILLATDHQRSVINALDENRPQPIAYTPYGHRPAENGLLSLLGFNGERPDQLTGHYHLGNGYRQFNPVLMRFNSPDSWSPFGEGGVNAYTYCGGDPRNRTDPTGHFWGIGKFFRRLFGIKPKATKARNLVTSFPVNVNKRGSTPTSKTLPSASNDSRSTIDILKKQNKHDRAKYQNEATLGQKNHELLRNLKKNENLGSSKRTRELLLHRQSQSLNLKTAQQISTEDINAFLVSKKYEEDGGYLVGFFASSPASPHAKLYAAMESEFHEFPSSEIQRTIRTGGHR